MVWEGSWLWEIKVEVKSRPTVMLLGLCCSLYNLGVAEWYKSALPFLIKSIYQRQAAAIPPHLFVVYYSPGVPKGLDGSKVSFHYITEREQPCSVGGPEMQERNWRKKYIRGPARRKSLWGNSKIDKEKNSHWECLCKTTIFSFLLTRTRATHFERERIERVRRISPSCPTLQSPTALLHLHQQAEMQNRAICDL